MALHVDYHIDPQGDISLPSYLFTLNILFESFVIILYLAAGDISVPFFPSQFPSQVYSFIACIPKGAFLIPVT